MNAPAASPASFVQRAHRYPAAFSVAVRGPTTPQFNSTVRNVSSSGMLIDDGGSLSVGDAIFAELPELGPVLCQVVRRRGGAAGVKFVSPIAVERLTRS